MSNHQTQKLPWCFLRPMARHAVVSQSSGQAPHTPPWMRNDQSVPCECITFWSRNAEPRPLGSTVATKVKRSNLFRYDNNNYKRQAKMECTFVQQKNEKASDKRCKFNPSNALTLLETKMRSWRQNEVWTNIKMKPLLWYHVPHMPLPLPLPFCSVP